MRNVASGRKTSKSRIVSYRNKKSRNQKEKAFISMKNLVAMFSIMALLVFNVSPLITQAANTAVLPTGTLEGGTQVDVCHNNNGASDYSLVQAKVNAIVPESNQGHPPDDSHEFDVIPPFNYSAFTIGGGPNEQSFPAGSYPGRNWDEDLGGYTGEELFNNNCNVPDNDTEIPCQIDGVGGSITDTGTIMVPGINGAPGSNDGKANAVFYNSSDEPIVITFVSYKMYIPYNGVYQDTWFSTQTIFDYETLTVPACSSAEFEIEVPDCMTQLDLYGGEVQDLSTFPEFIPGVNELYDWVIVGLDLCESNEEDDTVKVTIVKYLDGELATAQSANNTSFPMESTWVTTNFPSGTGNYALGPVGFNNPTPYYATTSDMNVGANYTTHEITGGVVGTACEGRAQYALAGYSTGNDLASAQLAGPTLTVPELQNIQSDKYIIVWNISCEDEEPEPCVSNNLVVNGSFEEPVVVNGAQWDIYPDGVTGWDVEWTSAVVGGPDPANIELHRGVAGWNSSNGSQHTELDSDWGGPSSSQTGEAANIKISQTVTTVVGGDYDLTFDFSPRPGQTNNQIEVRINGALKSTITQDGSANGNTVWTSHSVQFTGTGSDIISFEEIGTADSLGSFLDNVQVKRDCDGDEGGGEEPVKSADLEVTKEVNDQSVTNGQQVTYTVNVTNHGPDTATNVKVDDALPDGLTWVSDDSSGAYNPGTGIWTIGTLLDDQKVTLNIVATVTATVGTQIINEADVNLDPDIDINTDNDHDEIDITVVEGSGGGGNTQGNSRSSSSSGGITPTPTPTPTVLGETIEVPPQPQVQGATLPTTGTSVNLLMAIMLAGTMPLLGRLKKDLKLK